MGNENDIIRDVMDYFQKRGDFPYRTNNLTRPNRKSRKLGIPDIHVAMKYAKCCYIETKCTGVQSKEQKDFQKEVESRGHIYILAYSLDDVTSRLQRVPSEPS